MIWSQLRAERTAAVESLLDGLTRDPEDLQIIGQDEAADIIHATIWLRSARRGSAAGVYAWSALANALGPERLKALLASVDADS